VASSGFFTHSYVLFATNVILPALAYVYWPDVQDSNRETIINLATLASSIVGMLVFGYLADRLGRQRLYGIELILVSVSALGFAQTSYGVQGPEPQSSTSMSIMSWLLFWRIIMGISIGAEYPLSATISAGT
jgi:PHS family inorganic phosphate transporter-like MFS transporter